MKLLFEQETPFEKELVKHVDSIVAASGKNLKKLDRFKEGCYSHVKETKACKHCVIKFMTQDSATQKV